MLRGKRQFASILLAAALALLLPGPSTFARQKNPPRLKGPGPGAMQPTVPQERRMLDLPPRWIERVQQMAPQQQQRFLRNNERFRSLPPQRQQQIRNQLQAWNNLSPEQRQTILQRQRVWERLTPEQQHDVTDTLLPKWQGMPPARRQAILRRLRDLNGLDDSQRAARLNDEQFLEGLSPDERQMLRDLSNLRVAGPEPPGL